MNCKDYRNALRNMHNLVDELEDVTLENKVLSHENRELEKDVEFIADKHNKNVEALRELANDTREYRVGRVARQNECECECCCQHQQEVQPKKKEEDFDFGGFMNKMCAGLNMLKWKAIFVIALLLVILLAIGASPSNIVSWQAFTDLYIEYICNPATMAMSVALVMLLYKGIVKRHKK